MSPDEVQRKARADFLLNSQNLREQLASPDLPMSSDVRKVKADCLTQGLFIMTSDTGIDSSVGLFEYAIIFELACMRALFGC